MTTLTPVPRSAPESPRAVETAWHALAVVQASVTSMEESAARIVAAQLAGLIALWTQLFSWEEGLPEVLAWSAWVALVGGILLLAPIVTPRRLARFWTSILPGAAGAGAAAPDPAAELAVVQGLLDDFMTQRVRMARGVRRSVMLGALALVLVVAAYALEQL